MNNCDNYSDREFVELLLCALDGALNEEQFNSLQKQIVSNGDAQELYYDFLITYAGLSRFGKSHTSLSRPDPVSEYDDLLALMAEHERTAPAIEIPKEKPKREPVKMLKIEKVPRQVSKFSLYTLIISAAAMLLFVLWLQLAPVLSPIVATLTDSIDAEWGDTKDIVIGDVLRQEEMTLLSGLAEITFEKGAKVVLEAPVKIELNDINQMFLHEGKLAARVPPEAYGFTVDTPDASIKDIGTSFGVNVREGRASEVFVFKGKIKLVAKDEEKQAGAEQIVTQGQAKSVTANGREIKDIDINKELFLKKLPTAYELVIRKSRPLAYWRFDQDNPDRLGNIINQDLFSGEISGDASYETDVLLAGEQRCDALSFDGYGSHVKIPDIHRQLNGLGTISYSMWIRPEAVKSQDIVVFSNNDRWYRRFGMNAKGQLEEYCFDSLEDIRDEWLRNAQSDAGQDYGPLSVRAAASTANTTFRNINLEIKDATNGIGLDKNGSHIAASLGSHWMTSENDSSRWLVADLGGRCRLKTVNIWNMNFNQEYKQFGFRKAKIYVSDVTVNDPGNPISNPQRWTLLKEVQLNQAPGLGNYDTPDIIDLDGVLASHVAIICEETFHESSGGKRRLAGLSEVQFIGSISGANKYNNEDTLIQTPLKSHIISDRPLQVGQWHHVVVTFTSEGYKQIYINGVSAGVPVREVLFRYLGTDMYIGAVPGQQNIINLTKPFTGSIAELALYDRTLTPDEIKRIYQTVIESY